jgi:hypothetical protein
MPDVDDAHTTAAAPAIAIDQLGSQLPCPRCSRVLRVIRNEYFGVGLAVHEWLHVCPGCTWFAFAPCEDVEAVVSGGRRLPRWVALFQRHGRYRPSPR